MDRPIMLKTGFMVGDADAYIALEKECTCIFFTEGYPDKYCPGCFGSGYVLTEEGQKLAEFIKIYGEE